MNKKIKNNINQAKTTLFFSFFGMLFLSAMLMPAKDLKLATREPKPESKGTEIFISNVKYSLSYLGLDLCDPIEDQEHYTLVYSLGYNELSDKILLPIQQVLNHNNLQAGKLTTFPGNQGFSYRVLYKHRHVGNLIVINDRVVNALQQKDQLVKQQEIIEIKPKTEVVKKAPKKQPVVVTNNKPKMAIIIDDFGYSNNDDVDEFLKLNLDITVSIIPGHQFSTLIAQNAISQDKEIIIHMPMASDKEHLNNGEKDFLLSENLNEKEIMDRVNQAIKNIPHAVGMNNHMGSVATSCPDVVLPLLKCLKQKKLYFVDSLTSPLSIVYENCLIQDVPTGKRRLFLDNEKDKGEIVRQLQTAVKIAKKNGDIIVTGHTYSETLEAIKYMITTNQFSDVNICPASLLVK